MMGTDQPDQQSSLSDPRTWIKQRGDLLFRYAISRVGNTSIAEDLVQETFLAALKARRRFEGKSDERTWFVAILKNKIIDHFRRMGREVGLEEVKTESSQSDESFRHSGLLPGVWKTGGQPQEWMIDSSDPVEQKEFWKYLQLCIAKLSPRDAQAFVLREMEELEAKEICNKLGLSPTNLRVLLHRARLALRRCLEKKWLGVRKKSQ